MRDFADMFFSIFNFGFIVVFVTMCGSCLFIPFIHYFAFKTGKRTWMESQKTFDPEPSQKVKTRYIIDIVLGIAFLIPTVPILLSLSGRIPNRFVAAIMIVYSLSWFFCIHIRGTWNITRYGYHKQREAVPDPMAVKYEYLQRL